MVPIIPAVNRELGEPTVFIIFLAEYAKELSSIWVTENEYPELSLGHGKRVLGNLGGSFLRDPGYPPGIRGTPWIREILKKKNS